MQRPDVIRVIIGAVLPRLSHLSGLRLEQLTSAAVTGMMQAVTQNTALLDTPYTQVIGALADELGRCVADQSLTPLQATDLLAVVTAVIPTNPRLFIETA